MSPQERGAGQRGGSQALGEELHGVTGAVWDIGALAQEGTSDPVWHRLLEGEAAS